MQRDPTDPKNIQQCIVLMKQQLEQDLETLAVFRAQREALEAAIAAGDLDNPVGQDLTNRLIVLAGDIYDHCCALGCLKEDIRAEEEFFDSMPKT
jgi:hypothetical protein